MLMPDFRFVPREVSLHMGSKLRKLACNGGLKARNCFKEGTTPLIWASGNCAIEIPEDVPSHHWLEWRLTLKVTGPPTRCGPKIKACTGGSG